MPKHLKFTCISCNDYEIEYVEKSAKIVIVTVDDEIIYKLEEERRYFRCYLCEKSLRLNGKVVTTTEQLRQFLWSQAEERQNDETA